MEPSSTNVDREEGLPAIAPDFVEQDWPEEIDNIIPTRGYQMMPMVGLGASAGGIQALSAFFKAMPPDSGLVFVVILHLSPAHESTIAELLGRTTAMKVVQAADDQKVEPNHVYVIPPGKFLVTVDGHLRLRELESERGKRVTVDLFFRSLADTHGPQATAVVLSGADGDGALGIKRIKERGGLTIAQDPDQAEHPGMPSASIETGMVDWVLEVEQIPQRLLAYRQHAAKLKLPAEDGPQPSIATQEQDGDESQLRDVLTFLRMRTGHDFSYYKRATVLRRIGRRMQVNGVEDLAGYLNYLRVHPGEAGALLKDMLISVTNFFRDRDAFAALEQRIPEFFKNKTQGDIVRVWVPACATGDEAYSIAMLLLEHVRHLDGPPSLQVFACDLDGDAIQAAREGRYPEPIVADVSEQRLARFFVKDSRGYRVRRELREMVLFAEHDLLKDPPFSRMDLISCRNLLIYLNRDAQKRALDVFHFALNPGGLLFLGSSEGIDEASSLFRVVDKKHRIYVQQATGRKAPLAPSSPNALMRVLEAQERSRATPVVHGKWFLLDPTTSVHDKWQPKVDRTALAALHLKLIEMNAAPSVVVTADHEIVHLSERFGRYLKLAGGEPTTNLLRLIDPEVRVELRMALFRAVETKEPVRTSVTANVEGQVSAIDIRVSPINEDDLGLLLVVFDERPAAAGDEMQNKGPAPKPEAAVHHLDRELEQVRSHLRDSVEQNEAAIEELKASNEELQAMNEELRSATEELETSREELQSINEELLTVNQEMKGKVEELEHANSDMQNLMAATAIATIFLDRDFAITRYTPSATEIFHLIPGDVGRPLAHLKTQLDYPELMADAERVMRTLVPVEREVREDGHWYFARLQPYRTLDDRIAGIVLTLAALGRQEANHELLDGQAVRFGKLLQSPLPAAIREQDSCQHERERGSSMRHRGVHSGKR